MYKSGRLSYCIDAYNSESTVKMTSGLACDNKMVKPLYCCLFLPVTLVAALCTDTGIISKFVCIGDQVQVFQNITSRNYEAEITLYKTFSDKWETIAEWSMQNVSDKYKQKVSLENGTIWIRDFQESDEATYVILYDDSTKKKEMQLCALNPPTLSCKPFIKHKENFLIASLNNPEYCGKPLASVRWMEYTAISYRNKTTIELQPGNEAGRYSVCIEGTALKCAKNSAEWDNCENFTLSSTSGNRFPQVSEIVRGLYPLIKNTSNEAVRTAVNMTFEQLKDVVVKPIVESNIKQLARLAEIYKTIMDEKQMAMDEKQKLINEKEVLLESMNATIKNLESKMEILEASFDDLEQNGIGSSIRLNNVTLGKDESCEEKVVDVITNMANVSISRDDIERCHPLGKPNKNGNRQLMIKFKSYKTKAKVFSQRKNMKGNDLGIYMIDDLTRPKPDLLNKLLKYKTSKRIAAFWIADGKIYATKNPGSYPKRINTMQDIEHLLVKAESSLFAKNEEKH